MGGFPSEFIPFGAPEPAGALIAMRQNSALWTGSPWAEIFDAGAAVVVLAKLRTASA